jgi:hypothetical protein
MNPSNDCCRGSCTTPFCSENSQSCDDLRIAPNAGQSVQLKDIAKTDALVIPEINYDIDQALDFALDFDDLELYVSFSF